MLKKIADLEATLGGGANVPAEVMEAFEALKASVQTDDDVVPDAA